MVANFLKSQLSELEVSISESEVWSDGPSPRLQLSLGKYQRKSSAAFQVCVRSNSQPALVPNHLLMLFQDSSLTLFWACLLLMFFTYMKGIKKEKKNLLII